MSGHATRQPQLLSNQDLADLMGWQVKTVHMRRYRRQSLPPAIVIGNTIRYRESDVDKWLRDHTTQGTDHESTVT
jgi:predicted DNA-binding transcriptional regulator AlpA